MGSTDKKFYMELFFRALADRTRLRLINLMTGSEVCVCCAGIVDARREGKWMHYRIVEPPDVYAASFLNEVRVWLAHDKTMQRDLKRLATVCCLAELPVSLQGAPLPTSLLSA
jgi:ArsR family transcriptional regulator